MVTIGITTEIKEKLEDERMENESVNDIIARLMDECEDIEPYVPLKGINIRVSDETFHRLKSLKDSPKESYGSVILRLINSKKSSIE